MKLDSLSDFGSFWAQTPTLQRLQWTVQVGGSVGGTGELPCASLCLIYCEVHCKHVCQELTMVKRIKHFREVYNNPGV